MLALREIHRGNGDPKIPCVLRKVDVATADALSLGENFGREAMHPLDEAEAFAGLARADGKDAEAIACEFGVTEHYVRQRMKLATLAEPVKSAYRDNAIDTATAEAFAAVPEDRQLEVWKELGGNPRHAEQVRHVIANNWIDATHAVFDLSMLPESVVSRDLFNERVLVERQAFMEAQAGALGGQRQALIEDGWNEVVVARREDVQDRLYAMNEPDREFDKQTERKLQKLVKRQAKLEGLAETAAEDPKKLQRIEVRMEALETEEQALLAKAPVQFSEETKAHSTAFLILDPDGRSHTEYRVPRRRQESKGGPMGCGDSHPANPQKPSVPTPDDLSDKQLATTFTHQALAVREALLKNEKARKCVLALILHDKVRSEALSVRTEPNGTTLHASTEGFSSAAFDRIVAKRAKLDPFFPKHFVEDRDGYLQLRKLSAGKLDALIDVLVVECITAHMVRPTELISCLAQELSVNIRDYWRPDVSWLESFKKIQLVQLLIELKGPVNAPSDERKKTELIASLSKLFADASESRIEDVRVKEKVNHWLPANMRKADPPSKEEAP